MSAPLKAHAAADLFPLLEGEPFDRLVADIRGNGLVHPIVLYEDKILDGRNRWRACQEAGVTPRTEVYRGKDPIAYVVSTNLTRRHLDESQRGMIAARSMVLFAAEAGLRQQASRAKPGEKVGRTRLEKLNHLLGPKVVATLPPPTVAPAKAREQAAVVCGVSARTVQNALKVQAAGTPALVAAVDAGTIPVSIAAKIAVETAAVQNRAVADIHGGHKPSVIASSLARAGKAAPSAQKRPARWNEADALVDVHDALDRFTAMWAERAESFEELRRAAAYWQHQLTQKESKRLAPTTGGGGGR